MLCKWCIWNKSYVNCGYEIKWRLILAVMNAILCNCVKKPEKKIQDFNGVWTRDLAIPVRCSRWEQVNCGFICSRERDECKWCIWNKSYVNCGYEIKWRLILAVMNAILCNCVKKPEKKIIQDFNGVWTRDLAIPVRCTRWEQVSCGFICSRERDECKLCIWNKLYVNCGYEIKWRLILAVMNAILCNCLKKPEKKKIQDFKRGLNPWPRDTSAMLSLGAGQLWVHMFPWKRWV